PEEPPEPERDDEEHVRRALEQVRRVDDVLRQRRQLAVQGLEDALEDRDEEEQHSDEHEGREADDHRRVDHRALDAPPDPLLLLDLERDAVEHDVEDAGSLAGLDHRDEQAREDSGMLRHRLREEETALDVAAQLLHDDGERRIVGLLLEDDERADNVESRLDHRGELARKDLKRLRLDLVVAEAQRRLPGFRAADLAQRVGEKALQAQLFARTREIRGDDLPGELRALRVDGRIGERGHSVWLSAAAGDGLRARKEHASRRRTSPPCTGSSETLNAKWTRRSPTFADSSSSAPCSPSGGRPPPSFATATRSSPSAGCASPTSRSAPARSLRPPRRRLSTPTRRGHAGFAGVAGLT